MDDINKNEYPDESGSEIKDDPSKKTSENGYTVTPEGGFYEAPPETASTDNSANSDEAPDEVANGPEPSAIPPKPDYQVYETDNRVRVRKKVKAQRSFSLSTIIVSVVLAAVIGAASSVAGMSLFGIGQKDAAPQNSSTAEGNSGTGSVNIDVTNVEATVGEAVAEKVTPSVVGIRTTVSVTNFFGGTQEASGEGSGVIYTQDGYIITNYHVIANVVEYGSKSAAIKVFLSSDADTGYDAAIVGYNISNDLAVIKINGKNLPAIEWADSSKIKVGQYVMAIGNPGGLEFMGSATWGIISGLNRVISDSQDGSGTQLIQTDAAINPGNSGGALVNIEGKLVGINSSKLVSESVEGMGFAIPSNTVKTICDKIIAKENNPDPYLGVTISERYDPETLEYWGYPVGAVIYSVYAGSPAEDAGLRQGDIITEFDGKQITHYSKLSEYVSDCKPGDEVQIKIYRNGRYYDGTVKIGSNNSQ
ncbi:MAG: trypsin-like peptidase domain-containing protein [Acutalibacteraceae bacterium]|nr:trypsin-like peptidase domain-containing protein [Acutalibacteraceae bacterium]